MDKKQVLALSICDFAVFAGLAAFVSVMPLYLTRLKADATVIGFFLAFAYLSLTISKVIAGPLSDHLNRRRLLLIGCGVLAVPLTWLMSSITDVLLLMILMGYLWLMTGSAMTLVDILAALTTESEQHRTRLFGILSLSTNLGLLVGSLVSGWIVDHWGYPVLFVGIALTYLGIPLSGLLMHDKVIKYEPDTISHAKQKSILSKPTFRLLFIASVLAQAANSLIFLSRPLIMDRLKFDATTITTAAAFGVLIILPFPLIIAWLTRRFGRKPIIGVCFIAPLLGLIILALSNGFWLFVLSAALGNILGISWVIVSALITDSFPSEGLGSALAQMSMTPWLGIVIGLSAGGVAIRTFTITPALLLAMLISLTALFLLRPIPFQRQ